MGYLFSTAVLAIEIYMDNFCLNSFMQRGLYISQPPLEQLWSIVFIGQNFI
jgi:hypothetical protein